MIYFGSCVAVLHGPAARVWRTTARVEEDTIKINTSAQEEFDCRQDFVGVGIVTGEKSGLLWWPQIRIGTEAPYRFWNEHNPAIAPDDTDAHTR